MHVEAQNGPIRRYDSFVAILRCTEYAVVAGTSGKMRGGLGRPLIGCDLR